jgi:hypothetical protein
MLAMNSQEKRRATGRSILWAATFPTVGRGLQRAVQQPSKDLGDYTFEFHPLVAARGVLVEVTVNLDGVRNWDNVIKRRLVGVGDGKDWDTIGFRIGSYRIVKEKSDLWKLWCLLGITDCACKEHVVSVCKEQLLLRMKKRPESCAAIMQAARKVAAGYWGRLTKDHVATACAECERTSVATLVVLCCGCTDCI